MPEGWIAQLLLALIGGIMGAAIGGVAAFILCGLVAIATAAATLFVPMPPITSALAWGSFFGPHVAFSAGVAAAAFAARGGKIADGKNIITPLYTLRSPGAFVVGALFGVTGYLLKSAFDSLPMIGTLPSVNSIALTVSVSGILARIAFGTTQAPHKLSTAPTQWHPWPFSGASMWLVLSGLAICSSILCWLVPASLGVATALAAASILAVVFGAKLPIWIHVAWAGEYGSYIAHDPATGVVFALTAALLAECIARKLLLNGTTHIDPPAFALALLSPAFPVVHLVYAGQGVSVFSGSLAVVIFVIGLFGFLKEDASLAGMSVDLSQRAPVRRVEETVLK